MNMDIELADLIRGALGYKQLTNICKLLDNSTGRSKGKESK
jgi:hypothetical protein